VSDLTIRVRLPAREVHRRIAELPLVLSGSKPDRSGLRSYFYAQVDRSLMGLIHEAYRIKAMGGTDSLGESWRALATKTIKKRLSPNYVARFPLSAKLLILRVSDTLFKSLAPGWLVGDDYKPPENQLYKLTRGGLELGTQVHYAQAVHKHRPLWPDELDHWLSHAIDVALGNTLERLATQMSRER
jgi:hypothetical protein